MVWGVKNFKSYIYGMPFTIITDNNALKALKTKSFLEGWLIRWAEYLAKYKYEIVHKPGKDNIVPDYLSGSIRNLSIKEMTPGVQE